jgi:LEA14-like dessication related protein
VSRKKLFSWIACLAVVVALSSCTTSQDIAKKQPILKLDSLAVDSVSLSDVVLRAGFSITNPYPLSIEITKGVIETFVEDRRLVYTVSENSFYVNAGKTEKATFLIRVKYEDMEKTIAHYTEKEELTLTVNALFEVSLPDIPTLPKRTLLTYSTAKVIPALKPVLTVSNFAFIWPTKESVAKALANAKKSPLAIVRILGIFAGKDDDQARRLTWLSKTRQRRRLNSVRWSMKRR